MAEDTTQIDETVATDDVDTTNVATSDASDTEDNSSEAATSETAAGDAADETAAPAQTVTSEVSNDDSSDDDSSDDSGSDSASESRARPASSELSESLSPLGDVSEERKEVEDGRSYEIIYIVRPSGDDSIQNVTNRVRTMIEEGNGAIDNVRVSESRRLAYPIKKEIEGSYVVINTRFHKSHLDEINRFFQLEDAVLRHMILREDEA